MGFSQTERSPFLLLDSELGLFTVFTVLISVFYPIFGLLDPFLFRMAPDPPGPRDDPEAARKAALARDPDLLKFLEELQFIEVPRSKSMGSPCFPSLLLVPSPDIAGRGNLFRSVLCFSGQQKIC